MSENNNIFVAAILSMVVIFAWRYFFEPSPIINNSGVQDLPKIEQVVKNHLDKNITIQSTERFSLVNDKVFGSVNLQGGRIDYLVLKNYSVDLENRDNKVILFTPEGTENEYFAEFLWESDVQVPDQMSQWSLDDDYFNSEKSVRLKWSNDIGIDFYITFELDDAYMFKVTKKIVNASSRNIKIKNLDKINRVKNSYGDISAILHEGPIGFFDGENVIEIDYTKVSNRILHTSVDSDAWSGFSEKYWASIIIPRHRVDVFIENKKNEYDDNSFSVSCISDDVKMLPNSSFESDSYFFVGAKELVTLDKYEEKFGIKFFDRVVDFGFLYFITKPLALILQYFNNIIGNFGLSILLLTVLVKAMLLPLSFRAQKSMRKMRELQPKIMQIKEQYGYDKEIVRTKTMALLAKNKASPASGCLPIILQIPVFFSLYKVLSVTIYMRHAPFYFWIKDLSSPDPTSVLTLFGLLNLDLPSFLHIGILPIMLGLSMFLQQKLGTTSVTDPAQARAMRFLPFIFVFVFASFPSGLVIYWIWSNLISLVQQFVINRFFFKN